VKREEVKNAVFRKIWSEIKYLCKIVTAGSKEARQLERVKRAFEEAYRATKNTTEEGGVKLSISRTQDMSWDDQIRGALYDGKNIRRNDTLVIGYSGDTSVGSAIDSKPLAIPLSVLSKASSGKDISHSIKRGKLARLDTGIKNAPITIFNPERNAIVYITDIKKSGMPIVVAFDMNATFDGDEVHKATSIHLQVDVDAMLRNLPETATVYVRKNELDPVGATNNLRGLAAKIKLIDGIVPQRTGNVNEQFSLSDSTGRELDERQMEWSKDSVVRDENGRLKVMYHGTSRGGFTQFNTYGSNYGLFGLGSYFTDSRNIAQDYTNKVATVHGNTDAVTRLMDAIQEDSVGNVVFYINKEKTIKVIQSAGNPIPRGLSNLDGFVHSITDPGSPVKMRISSVTEPTFHLRSLFEIADNISVF